MRLIRKPNFKRVVKNLAHALTVGIEAVCFLGGVALIAYGFWDWFRPMSFILPGALFVYIGLPSESNDAETPS